MPIYEFICLECKKEYKELTKWDEDGKWPEVICPYCDSKEKEKIFSIPAPPVFTNPRGTSKADSFDYVAGWNMNKAKEERRAAEEASHMGNTDEIYNNIDDISSGEFFEKPKDNPNASQ